MLNLSVACPAFSISSPDIVTAANSSPQVLISLISLVVTYTTYVTLHNNILKSNASLTLYFYFTYKNISGKKQEKVAQHYHHDHRSNHHAVPKVLSHENPTIQPENNNSAIDNNKSSINWEERRKLKFDLEKCDEDLKELKMIIESIRYSECDRSPLPPSAVVDENCGGRRDDENTKCSNMKEHTSPVSVLDDLTHLTRAPLISIYSGETTTAAATATTKNG